MTRTLTFFRQSTNVLNVTLFTLKCDVLVANSSSTLANDNQTVKRNCLTEYTQLNTPSYFYMVITATAGVGFLNKLGGADMCSYETA